ATARLLGATDRIRLLPSGAIGTASLDFRAWDQTSSAVGGTADLSVPANLGGITAFSSAGATASLQVGLVLTPVPEDSKAPKGDVVGKVAGAFITDADVTSPKGLKGLAIVGSTGGEFGAWQYSTNNGKSWTNLSNASDASARLLRDKDKVRFLPA